MTFFHRLLRFGSTIKKRGSPVWTAASVRSQRGLQWLGPRPQAQATLFSVAMGIVTLLLLIFSGVTAAVASAAAWVALMRHFAQTNADRQRRITESFSKAVEQLGSDKLEVRLGGIYSLERISKESPDEYWTVMENLTAFARERSRRNEADRISQDLEQRVSHRAYFMWREAGGPAGRAADFWADAVKQDEIGEPPATDIAAVLTVIKRRSDLSRKHESTNGWHLDLRGAFLKRADLWDAHLEGAYLVDAHLDGAYLVDAHLEGADLGNAHLEGANLRSAHLEEAYLGGTHLEGAYLEDAHLERAYLGGAHLEGAFLWRAHLDGADLGSAHLEGARLSGAKGLSKAVDPPDGPALRTV